ncbi:MAG: GMC oxidoreductase, partial [Actinomycetota bacterium]
ADAVAHGAHLIAGATVLRVEQGAGRWRVTVVPTGSDGPEVACDAEIVVLGAGSLGSTEILERSARAGLDVSPTLGTSVSGNGDFLGYAYDGEEDVRGVGRGHDVAADRPIGPCITGGFTVNAPTSVGGQTEILFEEGALPRPLARLAPIAMWAMSRKNPNKRQRDHDRRGRRFRSIFRGPYRGPLHRTMIFLGMGFDGDSGDIDVPDDSRHRALIRWPGAGKSPEQRAADAEALELGDRMDASYLRSPVFGKFVTVHPLGGCGMADDGTAGVVDHRGRVFRGDTDQVHDGLLVVDGSIIPVPLGKNPSFTITALAERAMAILLAERGTPPSTGPAPELGEVGGGITFQERMSGTCRAPNSADDAVLDLRLTVAFDDLDELDRDLTRPAKVRGTAEVGIPGLRRMSVDQGTMVLFRPSAEVVDLAEMVYDLRCTGEDGSRYRVTGLKPMHDHPGPDLWRDTTRLHVTVTKMQDAGPESPVARGRAELSVSGLLAMLGSMRATGSQPSTTKRLRAMVRFGWRFTQGVNGTYGKLLRAGDQFESIQDQPPKRDLDLPEPTTHWCRRDLTWTDADPGAEAMLKLQRYRGGVKGPVMLAPGFAMAASQFLVDTLEPNLVEQLVAAGYDVWLFDYRAGIDMPTSRTNFTVDDVATVDWPAAVGKVREISGADSVQVIAHCVGSMSLQMALLAGMEGVRSAITSQVTVHPRMHWSMRIKTRLRIPRLLEGLGVRTVEPETDLTISDRLLDVAVRVNPLLRGERCNNPVCRWVFFFFGPTHVHDQLDPRTHHRIAELFGVASLEALDHIAQCVNAGHVVDSAGRDVYLPFIERFRVPITFLVGERNKIFYPSSTRATLAWLKENTPPEQFDELYRELSLGTYAHLDNFIGKNAPTEVFPRLIEDLDRFN